jgi:DNA-binding response OmpR family regulator
MPGEDGLFALIRQIRASMDAGRLPAAALSAHVDKSTKAHAADAGFQEYLTKPIDAALLARVVARLARSRAGSPHASWVTRAGERRRLPANHALTSKRGGVISR